MNKPVNTLKHLLALAAAVLLLSAATTALAAEPAAQLPDTATLYVEAYETVSDGTAPIAGSEFQLWQKYIRGPHWTHDVREDVLLDTAVTDEDGRITFTVPADAHRNTYYLVESAPAFGFSDANALLRWSTVKLAAGETDTLRVPNDRYTGSIVLSQTGDQRQADGSLAQQPLQGVRYRVYTDAAGTQLLDDRTFVTDRNGQLTLTGLYAGTYYAREVSAPRVYRHNTGVISLGTVDCADKVLTPAVESQLKLGTITLENTNASDGLPLAGARFQLWQKNVGNTTWGGRDRRDICVASGVTDETGSVTFTVPVGTYYLRQEEAPFGFKPLGAVLNYTTAKVRYEGDDTLFRLDSYRYYGSLELTAAAEKRTADGTLTAAPAANILYGIYTDAACTDLYAQAATDRDGRLTLDTVPAGTYYAAPVRTPYGYHTQAVALGTLDAPEKVLSAQARLDLNAGTLTVTGAPGASFALWQKFDGSSRWDNCRKDVQVGTLTLDDSGFAAVSLTAGTYFLREAAVPQGYESVSAFLPFFQVRLAAQGEQQLVELPLCPADR